MLYCKNCKRLVSETICPSCGKQSFKEPQSNDPVYLITKDGIMASPIEDILSENKIPYLKKGLIGAGITARIGFTKEIYEFYVPFSAYNEAEKLLYNFFDEDGNGK